MRKMPMLIVMGDFDGNKCLTLQFWDFGLLTNDLKLVVLSKFVLAALRTVATTCSMFAC